MTKKDQALIAEAAKRLRPLLRSARMAVLCTHITPDGDGIGAEICLHRHLTATGIEARILNTEPLPERYLFLDPDGDVKVFDEAQHGRFVREADLIFMLDNSAVTRMGSLEDAIRASRATKVCIDHHNVIEPFWTVNIIDEEACATGELIFQIIKALGGRPDLRAAQAAYVSMVTDTGYFRYSKTSPRCHEAAAEMLTAGVNTQRVYQEVFQRSTAALVRLSGVALSTLRLEESDRLAWIMLTLEQIRACRAEMEDTSDVINELLSIDGVRVAALFKEQENGRVKLSFRSKGGLDVNRLAASFGGGGHTNASGAVIESTLDDAVRDILPACRRLLQAEP